jgi:hypothetical protein
MQHLTRTDTAIAGEPRLQPMRCRDNPASKHGIGAQIFAVIDGEPQRILKTAGSGKASALRPDPREEVAMARPRE